MEKVLVLSGLSAAAQANPRASVLADLKQRLAALFALIKSRLAEAKTAANHQASATKEAAATGSSKAVENALGWARANAQASVLARNAQAQLDLLKLHVKAVEKGNSEAAHVLAQGFNAISEHSASVVPYALPSYRITRPDAVMQRHVSRGLGSLSRVGLGLTAAEAYRMGIYADDATAAAQEAEALRQRQLAADAAKQAALNEIASDEHYLVNAVRGDPRAPDPNQAFAIEIDVTRPARGTLVGPDYDAWNFRKNQLRAGGQAPYAIEVEMGREPFKLLSLNGKNYGVTYNYVNKVVGLKRMDDTVLQTLGNAAGVVADGVKAIADAAAAVAGFSCSVIENPLVNKAASLAAGVDGISSSVCSSSQAPAQYPVMAEASSGWVLPVVLGGGILAALKIGHVI